MNIPSGFAMVRHFFTASSVGREAMFAYGVSLDGALTGPQVANSMHDGISPLVNDACPSTAALIRTEVQYGPNPSGPTFTHIETITGGYTGNIGAPQVAVLVKKITAFGGRTQRGRFYIPFISEAAIDEGGVLTSAYYTQLDVEVQAILAAYSGADYPWVLLHTSPSASPTAVVSLELETKVATQRRRLVRT
jgi:hypothetical protein